MHSSEGLDFCTEPQFMLFYHRKDAEKDSWTCQGLRAIPVWTKWQHCGKIRRTDMNIINWGRECRKWEGIFRKIRFSESWHKPATKISKRRCYLKYALWRKLSICSVYGKWSSLMLLSSYAKQLFHKVIISATTFFPFSRRDKLFSCSTPNHSNLNDLWF